MNSHTEPVRLNGWAAVLVGIALNFTLVVLTTNDWRAAGIATISWVAPLVGVELGRRTVDSPETVERKLDNLARVIDLSHEDG